MAMWPPLWPGAGQRRRAPAARCGDQRRPAVTLPQPAARRCCPAPAATSRGAPFIEGQHERAPGYLGMEPVRALAPPSRRADRDVDLPGQAGTGSLGCLVELVPVRVADDEQV